MSIFLPDIAIKIPDVLLPNSSIHLRAWSVIACDQFTGNLEYWKSVEQEVGDNVSTLHLILPEVYLHDIEKTKELLSSIQTNTHAYMQSHAFVKHENSLLIIKRTTATGTIRTGIAVQIDLAHYNPDPSSHALIKATEEIVPSRLTKRIEVRKNTTLDFSHVLMLYSDPNNVLISELTPHIHQNAYETDLMLGGGHVHAQFCEPKIGSHILKNFFGNKKMSGEAFLAVGDGNHSLMAAKQTWLDAGGRLDHPDRFALVELINIFDSGLSIEPIHRILFDVQCEKFYNALREHGTLKIFKDSSIHDTGVIVTNNKERHIWHPHKKTEIEVEALEKLLEIHKNLYSTIDFIHDASEVIFHAKSDKHANIGFIFPKFDRNAIFRYVHDKRLFPRKSFSLGTSTEKRYYIEACERIGVSDEKSVEI